MFWWVLDGRISAPNFTGLIPKPVNTALRVTQSYLLMFSLEKLGFTNARTICGI
jgi:hypothetical protein